MAEAALQQALAAAERDFRASLQASILRMSGLRARAYTTSEIARPWTAGLSSEAPLLFVPVGGGSGVPFALKCETYVVLLKPCGFKTSLIRAKVAGKTPPWPSNGIAGLTCLCAAQERASEINLLREKVTRITDAEELLRRDLEAERAHAKVPGLTSITWAHVACSPAVHRPAQA